jgi:drug/metabolite transporter (DMT)-like permease
VKKGFVYIGLAALLFSTMEIALKSFSLGFNPLQLSFLRFAIGALVLFPLAVPSLRKRLEGKEGLGWKDAGFFALSGFVCVVVSMTLYQLAVTSARASIVAVIFSCNPMFVVPLAALVLGERITPKTLASLAASLAGIACIAVPAFASGKAGNAAEGMGIVLTILSAITFAVYGVMGKKRSARYGGLAMTCGSFVFGAAELLVLILISRIAPVAAWLEGAGLGVFAAVPVFAGLTAAGLPGLLYIGVCVTGLGYAFYFLGMEATSAQTGSVVFFIKPALSPVLALAILGEAIGPNMLAGIALILAGSGIALSAKPKKA